MLSTFKAARKVFFFPVRWANSVTNWCLGLNSPTGTIRVKNTANPGDTGAEIDVDVEVVASKLRTVLSNFFLSAQSFMESLSKRIDGTSIVEENGTIRVSEDWVKRMSGQENSGKNVTNIMLYQLYKPEGTSHYYAVPYSLTFKNGLLIGCAAGSAVDIFATPTPNVPSIS